MALLAAAVSELPREEVGNLCLEEPSERVVGLNPRNLLALGTSAPSISSSSTSMSMRELQSRVEKLSAALNEIDRAYEHTSECHSGLYRRAEDTRRRIVEATDLSRFQFVSIEQEIVASVAENKRAVDLVAKAQLFLQKIDVRSMFGINNM
jgi:hypothetical protein